MVVEEAVVPEEEEDVFFLEADAMVTPVEDKAELVVVEEEEAVLVEVGAWTLG